MSNQRADSAYNSATQSTGEGDHDGNGNPEFEEHNSEHTDQMGNSLDSSNLLSTSEYSTDSYDSFFQDAINSFCVDMGNYYNTLEKIEQKEASVQKEIIAKTEEIKNLSRALRNKRDEALQAISQLTAISGFKSG